MLDIVLTLNEIILMTTHSYVLAGYGPQYKFDQLYQRIWYFIWDLSNPNLVYFLVLKETNRKLLLFIWSHTLIHIHYVFTWSTQSTINVIRMSSEDIDKRDKYPFMERYWYYVGTLHDIITHCVITYFLFKHILKRNTSNWVIAKVAFIFLLYSLFLFHFSNLLAY
jgi:hypothetical protein